MSIAQQSVPLLLTSVAATALACWAAIGAVQAWHRGHHIVDLALGVTAAVWLLHLVATLSMHLLFFDADSTVQVTHTGYQLLLLCVGLLLLLSAGVPWTWAYMLLATLAIAGAMALHWGNSDWWMAVNLSGAALLSAVVARHAFIRRTDSGWLALAGCVFGLGLSIDGALSGGDDNGLATSSHVAFGVFLLLSRHIVTMRAGGYEWGGGATGDFARSTSLEPVTGFGPKHDTTIAAVAFERRRIAQDLHDGIGSQIVNILSSLGQQGPVQQDAVALALERCLVELKMTVDGIDGTGDNVPEALGRLRYRVQHTLDKLGIKLAWKVQLCDELEAVRGMQAQQIIRIAQECLANVMRHAQASAVEVVCRFAPEADQIVLEVKDNGRGIARGIDGRHTGKGLENMRKRADSAGGALLISSKVGAGTRVRLTVPALSIG